MFRIIGSILLASLSVNLQAQTAQEILEEVIQRDLDRKASVQNFIVNQSTMGQSMLLYFEKVERTLTDGQSFSTFRLVPPNEIAQRQNGGNILSPQDMELYAGGLEQTGDALSREMANSGLPVPALMVPESYDEPWASPDPRVMTGSMALFMRAAAAGERERLAGGDNTDIETNAQQLQQLVADAELVGNDTINGRPAFLIRTDGVQYAQTADSGEQFNVDTVSLWIDREHYVPLQIRMDGIANIDGQQQEMFMEMSSLDYQQIGPLYESTRQVMRMGGMLTPEQEAQMAEAQEQMAQMEQQLAELSGPERELMQNMLGPQMEMMRNMVNNGTIEVQTLVERIRVNAGLPDQTEIASTMFGSSAGFPGGGGFAIPPASDPGNPGSNVPQVDADAVQAAQQECLQQKIEAAQESRPRRRGLGGLLGGVGRAVNQIGNLDIAGLAGGLFDPGASDEDIEEQARELGLSEEDIAECRAAQPQPSSTPALDF